MKRGKMIAGFWVRAVCFTLLLASVMTWALYVLIPKNDYGICPMVNYYQQQEDTIDLLAIGTSLGYAGVNTSVLWEEYGIAAYDLCGAEQPYWITYHYLREALKTQKPKLILLDAKASTYPQEYSKRGRVILGCYGIRDLRTRLQAIGDSVAEEEVLSYVLGWPQLHNTYDKVTWDSFRLPPDNEGRGPSWKGFIEQDMTEEHQQPTLVWSSTKRPMQAREEEYLIRVLNLIAQSGIPCLIVAYPNPDYANDHMYYNSVWHIARDYDVDTINFNDRNVTDPLKLRLSYSSDFADWQHLNVQGSVKFSQVLGRYLLSRYHLPDRRGDDRYHSWQTAADLWYRQYPDYHPSQQKD